MGIFDKLFNDHSTSEPDYTPSSEEEAWVSIMYACLMSDGNISEIERESIIRVLVFKTIFDKYDKAKLYESSMNACKRIGCKNLIDKSSPFISEDNKSTLLAVTMDLLLSDGIFSDVEKEIVNYLVKRLNMNEETAYKIVEVTLIKNKYNKIIEDY